MELIGILVLAALAWLWLDSLKAREVCAAEGLMFLDDTVAISGLKPVRDDGGRITLQRAYDFEYSDTGDNRLKGSVVMRGHRVVLLNVGPGAASTLRTLH